MKPARIALCLALAVVTSGQAADNIWTNTVGGSWSDAGNWSQGSVPDPTDTVRIGTSGTYSVTLSTADVTAAPGSLTNDFLNVHGINGGSPTFTIDYTQAATFFVSNTVSIGNGILNFNAPSGLFQIRNSHPNGLIMNNTSAGGTPAGTQGVINVQSGFFDAGSQVILANSPGTLSTINVYTGGTLFLRGNTRVGNNGTAEIHILGGDAAFGQGIVGYSVGATGRIVLVNGRMFVTNTVSGVLGIGSGTFDSANHGYGEIIISNGSFVTGNNNLLAIGSGVTATGGGGHGVLNVYGGNHTNNARIYVANSINSTGEVLMAGGKWIGGTTWFLGSGSNAFASLVISNGSYVSAGNTGGIINLGDGNYGAARLDLMGGELLMTNSIGAGAESYIAVGSASNAVARLNVSGGHMAILNTGGGLFIGTGNSAFGATTTNTAGVAEVNLTGGRLEVRRIAAAGTGVLSNRTGGLLQFVGVDTVTGSSSQFVVDGGTLSYRSYGSLNVTNAVSKFTVVSGSGLQLDSSTNVNLAGTWTLTNSAGNFKELSLTGTGPLWRSDSLLITDGSRLHVSNAANARLTSTVFDEGTILVENSTVTYQNTVTVGGRYISDPSTNTFNSNVTVNVSGTLEGGIGDLFDFKKNLAINSTNNGQFNLALSTVSFSGGGNHTNAVTGGDFGTNGLYTAGNFGYGALKLAAGDDLYFLSGGHTNGGASSNALYINHLMLANNDTNFVSHLHSTFNIYYLLKEHQAGNAYLNDQSYLLDGGGWLMPVIPEPSSLLLVVAAVGMLWRKRN